MPLTGFRSRTSIALGALLGFFAGSSPREAVAQEEDPCFTAALEGQKLRKSGKIAAAREQFSACARATCPAEVVERCTGWLKEAEDAQPSIVLEAVDANGRDVAQGEFSVDGVTVANPFDGQAKPIDPGPHEFVVRAQGAEPSQQRLVIREAEKNRRISFHLVASAPAPKPEAPKPLPEKTGGGVPAAAWIFGGVGVVAAGASAYFAVRGVGDRRDFGCDDGCSHSDYRTVKREFLIADITAGIAVLALGTATVFFVTAPASDAASESGALIGARGRF
jgi:hypothetical protein